MADLPRKHGGGFMTIKYELPDDVPILFRGIHIEMQYNNELLVGMNCIITT